MQARIDAACSVVERLRKKNAGYTQDVEHLAQVYIEMAYWDIRHLKTEIGN